MSDVGWFAVVKMLSASCGYIYGCVCVVKTNARVW
jgi:hypothetical protein